ncbi:MAG: DNA-directed RNA polymerase subunit H [Candidatus Undinarchaeales archaeon]
MAKKKKKSKKLDVSGHVYVPKHTLMSEEKVAELLEELGIEKFQLPKIKRRDPAIRGLKAKYGDVIKIERESMTAGKTDYYRVVI